MMAPRHKLIVRRDQVVSRSGLSLFEVVLALGIFLGAIAALSQLSSNGMRAAVQSRLQTHAILRCESKLNEVASAVEPLQASAELPFEDDPSWTWSLQTAPGPHIDVLVITVTVNYYGQGDLSSTSHSMSRLIRDPLVFQQAPATDEGTTS